MESAFGVEHGEISKISMPKIPKPFAGGGKRTSTPQTPAGNDSLPPLRLPAGKHKAGNPLKPLTPAAPATRSLQAGQTGLQRAGRWMKQNKKPLGIAGGAGAGGGAVGYGANRRKP